LYQDASLKLKRGDLNGARRDIDAVNLKDFPPDAEWPSRFRILKAEILWRQGMNKESLALLNPSLQPQFANSDLAVWQKMTQGAVLASLDRYDESEKFLIEAEELAKASQVDLLGEVALRKGSLAVRRDDLITAQSEYSQALAAARRRGDSYLEASALGNLGLVAIKQEHYDESIDWNGSALQLSKSLNAEASVSKIEGNMGWGYFEMGDLENALAFYKQAEESASRAGLSSDRVYWGMNIGSVYFAQKNYDSARRAYQNAIDLAGKLGDEGTQAECYENLALVAVETGQLDLAQRYNEKAVSFVLEHPDRILSAIISGRIEERKSNFAQAERAFETVIADANAPMALRWEAQARLAEVYASEARHSDADRQFRASINTIANAQYSVRNEELRLSFLSNAILFYNDYIEFLISQNKIDAALRVAEISRAQTLAEGLGLSSKISFPLANFHPRAIAQRFGATLLFYWLGEKHSYLWAITRSGISSFTLPPASEVEPLIKSYREVLLGPRDALETSNAQGIKLYEILVAPVQKLIAPGSRVIVLPDGGLYGLNFETLLNPKPQLHYWIEDAVVANANSLVLLAASANQSSAKAKKLLLVGDPISPSAEFPDLPQAATEMADVKRYFAAPDRTVLSRQQATAAAYLSSNPSQYSFIHFVAHGTASRASPLDSAVILTKSGDSYKLYARDIVAQPLRADLVTISACHGAGERTYSGEGLVGLTWAFLRAGAHGVVAALWEVNDNSTPELMNDLY
jgi:CHAT domain-containing protein/tetratricopeptide (TPR) repeat protein